VIRTRFFSNLILLPIFLEPDPLKACEWLKEMSDEEFFNQKLNLYESEWKFLISETKFSLKGEHDTKVVYQSQDLARVAFIKDIFNMIDRLRKSDPSLPTKHAMILSIINAEDVFSERNNELRELSSLFYEKEPNQYSEFLEKAQKESLEIKIKNPTNYTPDNLQNALIPDIIFLRDILKMETLYYFEDHDPEALGNMITLGKMISDALSFTREDFKTGKIESHKKAQGKLLRWMEAQVAASANLKTIEQFCEEILDKNGKIFKNKKFSEGAQYELLLHFKERNDKITENLCKYFDRNIINTKTSRQHLKALLFMEKAFPALVEAEQNNAFKKEQIQEEIVPYQEQNNILELIGKVHSFPAIEKEFRRMILDADRETLSALAATGYKALKHLVNNLFDKEKGLTKEECTKVSPDIIQLLESLNTTLNTEESAAQKKKNKNKTEEDKFSEAKNRISQAKPVKEEYYRVALPETYEKSEGLIVLKEKAISWSDLQKEIKNLGGEAYQDGYHYKITFYLGGSKEEPKVVTKKGYQEINGKEFFKHQMTKTTHVPHGKKEALDLQFQEDVMEMIGGLFKELI
jgi:hypothetical protein